MEKNARLRYCSNHNYQQPTLGCRHFLRGAPCYLRARKSKPEPEPEVRDHLAHPGTIGAWPGLVTSLRASWDTASLHCQHKGSTGRPSPMTEQNFNEMSHRSRNLCDWKLTWLHPFCWRIDGQSHLIITNSMLEVKCDLAMKLNKTKCNPRIGNRSRFLSKAILWHRGYFYLHSESLKWPNWHQQRDQYWDEMPWLITGCYNESCSLLSQ